MPTDKNYAAFITEQLSEIDGVSVKPMMGEYLIYVGGKVAGGIYDDRLLIKPAVSAKRLLENAPLEIPYDGARKMLLVSEVDDKAFLKELFESAAKELK